MDAANNTDKLHEVLASADFALLAGETATAMDALAELEAEAAGLRERLAGKLDEAGHVPLANAARISESTGPMKRVVPPMGDDAHAIVSRRGHGDWNRRY